MLEWIKQLDASLFLFLNRDCRNGLFDVVMPFITNRAIIVLCPFLVLFFIKEKKRALIIFAVSFFSVLLADAITNALKELIGRERPCNVFENVHLLVGCSKSFSTPSGHATNAFAFAAPFFLMTRNRLKYLFLFIALLVALSRVFVGVHYPLDVIAGAAVGSITAVAITYLFLWSERRYKDKPYTTILYVFLFALSIFRVYYIIYGPLDLSPDEAHYWEWSRRLDLSYYSKGPMIAYLIAISTSIFGDNVFGVRFFAVVFSVLSSLILYRLGKEMYNERAGTTAAILFQIIPLYSTFGVVFTIDSPFIFFWILSLHLFWKAINRDSLHVMRNGSNENSFHAARITHNASRVFWILLGFTIGLGLLTKYTMAFFYLCALFFLISSPRFRGLLKTIMPYVSFAISIIIFTPVIIWNAGHGWVTLRHTAGQANIADGLRVSVNSLVEFVGSQLGVVTPILFVLIMIALWRVKGDNPSPLTPLSSPLKLRGNRGGLQGRTGGVKAGIGQFLFWFSIPVIVFFVLKSVQGKVQANWAMTGYISGLLAFSEVYLSRWNEYKPALKRVIVTGIVFSLIVTVVGHYPSKFLPPRIAFKFMSFSKTVEIPDPSARLKGWNELGKKVTAIYGDVPNKDSVFIFSDSYQASSELAFYVKGHPVTYCVNLGRRMNQYDLWPAFHNLIHYNGIFVTIGDTELHPKIGDAFRSCEKRPLKVLDKERILREYSVFICRDFKGMASETIGSY